MTEVTIATFKKDTYQLRGIATELPYIQQTTADALKKPFANKHLGVMTSWKIMALYLQAGRDKTATVDKLWKLCTDNELKLLKPNIEKLVDAIAEKIDTQGIKVYIKLNGIVAASSKLQQSEREAFAKKPYNNDDPKEYLTGMGKETLENMAKMIGKKDKKDVKTDDFVAYLLSVLPIDPVTDGMTCDKIYAAFHEIATNKVWCSTVIDQLQVRLAMGTKEHATRIIEEKLKTYLKWRRDAKTKRLARAVSPPRTVAAKRQKSK